MRAKNESLSLLGSEYPLEGAVRVRGRAQHGPVFRSLSREARNPDFYVKSPNL